MKGVDISMLAQIEATGGRFYREDGAERDALEILRDHGVNWVRLRIWNNPVFPTGTTSYHGTPVGPGPTGGGNNDEAVVRGLARRAKALGMRVYLNFHYSDFWADPGKQDTPAGWSAMPAAELEQAVYDYTKQVIRNMRSDGAAPDIVSIGNEVNNGMLWPVGQRTGARSDPAGYVQLNRLLAAGARAVREASRSSKIMIHIANDAGLSGAQAFFDNVDPAVDYDCIGLSYYPYWHGTLADLQTVMNTLSARYRKPIIIAEMAYAYTNANGDAQGNSWSGNDPISGGFEVSVQGQATAMRNIMETVSMVPRGRGLGVFYWEPDWIPVTGAGWITGQGNGWENQAWWDFAGRPIESMWTYRLVSEAPGRTVPATITSIPAIAIQTTVGVAPTLPATVGVFFSDASYNQVPATWDAVSPLQYGSVGTFSVSGAVSGTSLTATASVSVVVTNHAVNGGFETGSLAPWITSAMSGGSPVSAFSVENSSPSGNTRTGSYVGSYWYGSTYSFDVHQTLSGLAPGTYTFIAWVMGDGAPTSLDVYADNGTKVTAAVTNTGWQQWHEYTLSGIVVGGSGELVIGFEGTMTGGDWGKLDDVTVIRE
jgi:arabinogalactan endo-1,4-beta-galactosidase